MQPLQNEIERLFALGAQAKSEPSAREVFLEFRSSLSRGKVRAAEKRGNQWYANVWVKRLRWAPTQPYPSWIKTPSLPAAGTLAMAFVSSREAPRCAKALMWRP